LDDERQAREVRFNLLFDAHYDGVRAFAWRRDPDLADDVAAETFAIAWRELDRLPAEPRAWLIGIARNVRLNLLRTEKRRTGREARGAAATAPRGDLPRFTDAIEERSALRSALETLSERDREVLLLTAWDDLSRSQVAVVVGCSRSAVAVRLLRARRRLAAALAGQETAPAAPADPHAPPLTPCVHAEEAPR
jgi:RNA polymerase sigma-70 factor (ECF subfamily)